MKPPIDQLTIDHAANLGAIPGSVHLAVSGGSAVSWYPVAQVYVAMLWYSEPPVVPTSPLVGESRGHSL